MENHTLRREAGVAWWTISLDDVTQHRWVKAKVEAGWADGDAQVLAGLAGLHAPLGTALRERSGRFAASLHAWLDAVSAAAARPERSLATPARLYANLEGEDGLEDVESAWRPEALLAIGVGGSFRTSCVVDAKAPLRCNFRDDQGWYAYTARDDFEGDAAFELQESDVVCFRCAADDVRGFHALIHEPRVDAEDDIYLLPPLATVRLESIEGPGEWEVILSHGSIRGSSTGEVRRPRRRLFTVSVEFGC